MPVELRDITFVYPGALEPVFSGLNVAFSPAWTGIVGANGSGKSTLLQLVTGALRPSAGSLSAHGLAVLCEQRTDLPPNRMHAFVDAQDPEAHRLRWQLGIEADWTGRWTTLSHGERKRIQIGVALWQQPDVLAIDEPTNHIDASTRDMLSKALAGFAGYGLLVSHDRELLDSLCHCCLFLTPGGQRLRPGGYSEAASQADLELKAALRNRTELARRLKGLESEMNQRKARAMTADQRRSKRHIDPKDHDAKGRINLAIVTGKDAVDGKLQAQLESRVGRLRQQFEQARVEVPKETGIWMPGEYSKRDSLFVIPPGHIGIPGGRSISHQGLRMGPAERVGIIGPNGGGKTTLVRHILDNLMLPQSRVLYMPQELTPGDTSDLLARLDSLPKDRLGTVLTVVSRLGSSASRAKETTAPSPGELRKLLLAIGILEVPHLIVMDEPTNHLDIVAIESLEKALSDCPCGLLLVSHDLRFLRSLVSRTWQVSNGEVREVDVL